MQTEMDYQTLQQQAAGRYQAGDLDGGIDLQLQLVNSLLDLGSQALDRSPELSQLFETASDQVIEMMRWQRRFDQAVQLQERLVDAFPENADAYRLSIAQMRVEGNYAEVGLDYLRTMAAQNPEDFWYQVSLATSYLWLGRYADAEPILRKAGEMSHVRKVDRALAYQYLFQMYGQMEERVEDALAAWRQAGRLDSSLRGKLLPVVCRMLIYQRRFDLAKEHIAMERNLPRKTFYQGLLEFVSGNHPAAGEAWVKLLTEYSPVHNEEAVDEYAEACVRLRSMHVAGNLLQPLVEAGKLNYLRVVVLGLAYAERRDLERARWFLGMALRMGDAERVRLTLPALQGRVLDMHARKLYEEVPLEMDVRQQIDNFFVPAGQQSE